MAPVSHTLNHYDVLGVARDASFIDIRVAYLKLVKIYHPDRATNPARARAALQLFQAITAAYATLRNPVTRREYDQSLNMMASAMPLNDNTGETQSTSSFWSRIFGSII